MSGCCSKRRRIPIGMSISTSLRLLLYFSARMKLAKRWFTRSRCACLSAAAVAVSPDRALAGACERGRSAFLCDRSGFDALSDRKSTRLNSSHQIISYAVFCLKKKKQNKNNLSLKKKKKKNKKKKNTQNKR